ncbi:MAG TPA: GAF domain-containing sensor histidine kinase [Baekduia sp.]|nr:GAF domain-containing sensor histidine kinase [Baekduia sp.]
MPGSAWTTQQLAEFLAAVSSARSEAAAARAAVERAAEALDAEVAAIVCDGKVVAAVGYPEHAAPAAELGRVTDGPVACELAVPGVGVCPATGVALEYPPGATLVLARSGTDGLQSEERALLRGMARVASMTLQMLALLEDERAAREASDRHAAENARLLAALQDRQALLERLAAEQAALRRVATLVAGQAAGDDIFMAVAEEVGRLLGADLAGACRYEPDGAMTVLPAWSSGALELLPAGQRLPLDGPSVAATVLRSGRAARMDDYSAESGAIADRMNASGVRSSIGAPIVVDGRVWGAMIVSTVRSAPFPWDGEERLSAFTELVATALSNAQARSELARLVDEQAALRRVATLVARAMPPERVFAAATEEVTRLLGADQTVLIRRDAGDVPTFVAVSDADGTAAPRHDRRPVSERVWRSVLETGRAARIQVSVARCAIGYPVVVDGGVWGAITVSIDGDVLSPADVEARLARFTDLLATAISNAASREQLAASRARVVATADETRRRIGRDLHDGIQQRLVTLGYEVRMLNELARPLPDEVLARIARMEQGLSDAVEELREVARGVHPAILSKGGLGPALKSLARLSPLPVRFDVEPVPRLPEPVEVAVYYVVCEAMANAAKHAQATAVDVHMALADGLLRVAIRDDGVGGLDRGKGSGIVGLIDRVEALDGTLRVTSPVGEGTSIHVELPMRAPSTSAHQPAQPLAEAP